MRLNRMVKELSKRTQSSGPARRTRARSNARRQRTMDEFVNASPVSQGQVSPRVSTPHKIQLPEEVEDMKVLTPRKNEPARIPRKTGKRAASEDSEAHENVSSRANVNHKLTEYFPVRRSVRRTKRTVLEEKQKSLETNVVNCKEEGLSVITCPGKGRGVITTQPFSRGEFVVEYFGELIDMTEARLREERYAMDQAAGCYMYYFRHLGVPYCIDATAENGRLGRLVNHSRNGNLMPKVVCVKEKPHLVLLAKTDLDKGVELCYDYGDRSKESLKHHPWLAS